MTWPHNTKQQHAFALHTLADMHSTSFRCVKWHRAACTTRKVFVLNSSWNHPETSRHPAPPPPHNVPSIVSFPLNSRRQVRPRRDSIHTGPIPQSRACNTGQRTQHNDDATMMMPQCTTSMYGGLQQARLLCEERHARGLWVLGSQALHRCLLLHHT